MHFVTQLFYKNQFGYPFKVSPLSKLGVAHLVMYTVIQYASMNGMPRHQLVLIVEASLLLDYQT